MNKTEIAEIRKLYKPEYSVVSKLAGCYVDGEKNKKSVFRETLLALPEEDVFKYLELLKKGLSGSIGRNIANVEFPLEAEDEGTMHELLMNLRSTELCDETELDRFYDILIEKFEYVGNYLILLTFAAYDVPGKASDGTRMEDASEEVYKFLQCVICPVELSKPGLSYNEENGAFSNRFRDWVVSKPDFGFLFPAFTARSADIHGMLLYSKNIKSLREEMVKDVFGCQAPAPAPQQKNIFASALETALGDELNLEAIRELNDSLLQMKEEMALNKEPVEVDAADFKYLMKDTGISDARLNAFRETYDEYTKDSPILLDNIVAKKTMEVKTDSVTIRVPAEKSYLITEKVIDGKRCLVVDIDGENVSYNGVMIAGENRPDGGAAKAAGASEEAEGRDDE